MSSTVEKYFDNEEAKVNALGTSTIEIFESEYPELSNEFKQIQEEMYDMFARKHMDYGLNNIALGGDISNYGIIGLLVGRNKWKK